MIAIWEYQVNFHLFFLFISKFKRETWDKITNLMFFFLSEILKFGHRILNFFVFRFMRFLFFSFSGAYTTHMNELNSEHIIKISHNSIHTDTNMNMCHSLSHSHLFHTSYMKTEFIEEENWNILGVVLYYYKNKWLTSVALRMINVSLPEQNLMIKCFNV